MGLWEERSLLCVTHLPTHRHRTHAGWGGGGLCGSWGLRTWAGASATLPGGGWVQENPAPCPGLILPTSLCPCTRLACQPHKALFMPGEWPGGREPQRAAGGGGRKLHMRPGNIWKHSREAPATALSSGVGHEAGVAASPHPSLPAGRPPPQAPPSQPQRLLTPATSKEAEGEPRAERGRGLAGLGLGSWVSRRRAGAPTDDSRRRPDGPLRLPSV